MNGPPPDVIQRAVRSVVQRPPPISVGPGQNPEGRIARIRQRHHSIARMVAANLPDERICKVTGITQVTLDLLRDQTPAFIELVAYYAPRSQAQQLVIEEFADILERNMIAVELELADRIAEEPEKFTNGDLIRAAADRMDRLGYSKHSVNIQVNATLGERLEGLRRRSRPPAGAGDGGGALSPAAPGSAPLLLDLKAEPAVPVQESEAVLPTTRPQARPPDPKHPLRPGTISETIMAGRDRRVVPDASAFESLRRSLTVTEPEPTPINRFKPDPAPEGRFKRRKL